MESYLTGRGDSTGNALPSSDDDEFRSYLEDAPKQVISPASLEGVISMVGVCVCELR